MFGIRCRDKQWLMPLFFRTVVRSLILRHSCPFTTVAVKRGASPRYDAVQDLLKEQARLLRVVEKRIDERARLQAEVGSIDEKPKSAKGIFPAVGRHVLS